MTIRPARDDDWPRIGVLAEELVRTHHGFDARRFIHPDTLRADAYVSHLRADVRAGHAVVLIAERAGTLVGYVFAGVEPESRKELRGEAGYIHDLVVDQPQRETGVGRALLSSAIDWFDARGIARVMLWTAPFNERGRHVFERAGFRQTMIEMTLDRTPASVDPQRQRRIDA